MSFGLLHNVMFMYRLQEVDGKDLCFFVLDLLVLVLVLVSWTEVSYTQDEAILLELHHPAFRTRGTCKVANRTDLFPCYARFELVQDRLGMRRGRGERRTPSEWVVELQRVWT